MNRPAGPVTLLALALAECLLSLYQWMEMVVVRAGGKASCAINETMNCTTVWSSHFAGTVHDRLGVPVAALGLAWGLTAFTVTVIYVRRLLANARGDIAVGAIRLVGAAGALSCITFGVASMRVGALCPTCLVTYALVIAFAVVAWRLLPGELMPAPSDRVPVVVLAGLTTLVFYLALLYPGLSTPKGGADTLAVKAEGAPVPQGVAEDQVKNFLATLSYPQQQALSDAINEWRNQPVPENAQRFKPRLVQGSADAPMKLIEFTDILCSHCKALNDSLHQIEKLVPADKLSVEARNFPLAGDCNKLVQNPDTTGVRCLAAKALICLESTPDYWRLRDQLFDQQESLTPEKVMQIASSGSMSLEQLNQCVGSEQTDHKLQEDIAFAMLYRPDGTPVVVVNGKLAPPSAAWLYAMAMAGADPTSKAFSSLPPPR